MALITGGNVLLVAMVAMIFMVIVVGAVSVSVFDLSGQLSMSLANIIGQEQVASSEKIEEVTEEAVGSELDSEEARKLLGFIEYPVVNIQTGAVSIFSPLAIINSLRLSEEKIVERCAYVTIPFNNARCLRAERGCAAVLGSSKEHWTCLQGYEFYIGKKL